MGLGVDGPWEPQGGEPGQTLPFQPGLSVPLLQAVDTTGLCGQEAGPGAGGLTAQL